MPRSAPEFADMADTEELVDYEEEEVPEPEAAKGETVKKGYVGIHSSGFKDFLLKPELLRAIQDCGFEHPSEGEVVGWDEGGRGCGKCVDGRRRMGELEERIG